MSSDLTEGAEVVTLLGKTLKVSLKGGASINGVKVKKADVNVSNGGAWLASETWVNPGCSFLLSLPHPFAQSDPGCAFQCCTPWRACSSPSKQLQRTATTFSRHGAPKIGQFLT